MADDAVARCSTSHHDPSTRVEGSCASCASLQASIRALEAKCRTEAEERAARGEQRFGANAMFTARGAFEEVADALAFLTREKG